MGNTWEVNVWVRSDYPSKEFINLTIYSGENPFKAFWTFLRAKKKHDTGCVSMFWR